ncbi:MAG: DUF2304 domain-containing protein [Oligoflexia bacterium]|nr:DUF2304 domain-containing protein [Oligoflexia bacterium]
MGIKLKIISIIVTLVFVFFVFKFIKKSKIRPSSAILWLTVCAFLLSIPVFEKYYQFISLHLFGMVHTIHFIYIGLIVFLLIYSFYLTIQLNKVSDRVQFLITHTAINEKEIRELKKNEN